MSMNNIKRRVFNSMGFPGQKEKLGDEIYSLNQKLTETREELTTEKGKVTQLQKDKAALSELLSFVCEKKTVENTDGTETLPDSLHQPVQKFIFYGASDKDDGVVIGAEDPTATLTDGEDETDSPATHTITANGYTLHGLTAASNGRDTLTVNSDRTGEYKKWVDSIALATLTWNYENMEHFFYTQKPYDGPDTILCDGYTEATYSAGGMADNTVCIHNGALEIRDSDYTTVEEFVEALGTKKLYHCLAEEVTTELTSAQVNTILGGAKTFKGSTDVEASNDNSLTQPFSITYVKNLMES